MSVPGATSIVPCPCSAVNCVSTIFIFDNVQYQNSANTVYNRQQDYNAQPKNVAKGRKFQFKNDYERMQALIGRYGVAPACQRR
jgi:hypothetical protein